MSPHRAGRVPLQVARGCVQVSVPSEVSLAVLTGLRADLLGFVEQHPSQHVLVDLAGLRMVDEDEWTHLKATLDIVSLLGRSVVLTGIRPGVVAALVELELPVPFAVGRDLDHGFRIASGMERA